MQRAQTFRLSYLIISILLSPSLPSQPEETECIALRCTSVVKTKYSFNNREPHLNILHTNVSNPCVKYHTLPEQIAAEYQAQHENEEPDAQNNHVDV